MSNPYSSPQGNFGKPTRNSADALGKVKGPAIGLMVAMGIGIAFSMLALVLNVLGVGLGAAAAGANDPEGIANLMGGTVGIISNVVGIGLGGLIIFGCMKMMKLESYGLAMAVCILSVVPCTNPCCLLGIPFGIWGIVVLNDAAVKSSFR